MEMTEVAHPAKTKSAAFRPTVFLTSSESEEGARVVHAIRSLLEKDCRVILWIETLTNLEEEKRESLIEAVEQADLAVLVLANDELGPSIASSHRVRDQVMLELGMFMGLLGWNRTLLVCREGHSVDLPFEGLNVAHYAARRGNLQLHEAVEAAWASILRVLGEARHQKTLAPSAFPQAVRSSGTGGGEPATGIDDIDQLYADLRRLLNQEGEPEASEKIQKRFQELRRLQGEEAEWMRRRFESRLHLKPGDGWKALETARNLLEDEDPSPSDLSARKQN